MLILGWVDFSPPIRTLPYYGLFTDKRPSDSKRFC